jgi:hypothetical protein
MRSSGETYLDALEVQKIVVEELKRRGVIPAKIDPSNGVDFVMGCCSSNAPREKNDAIPDSCDTDNFRPYLIGMTISHDLRPE